MDRVLLLTLILILGATLAFAQWNGSIVPFADNTGLDLCLPHTPGLLHVYFFHRDADGATASQWAAPPPVCVTAIHVADIPVFAINLGDTETGITIGYTGYPLCKTGAFHIITALYQVTSVGDCCEWRVVADPNLLSGKIEVPDCGFMLTYAWGGAARIGTNLHCCSIPTEDTTWGAVKALYTE